MSQRTDRVDELLRQEIGQILAKDVQDPHIGFATVTDVETTPDLRHARVWVSVIGGAPERAETLAALDRAMGYVRHELGVRLRLKRIPALHVSLDDSAERGTRVLRILDELEQGHDAAGEALADAPRSESLPTPVPRVRAGGRRRELDELGSPRSRGRRHEAASAARLDPGAASRRRPPAPARRPPTPGPPGRRSQAATPRRSDHPRSGAVTAAADLAALAAAVPDAVVERLAAARSVLAVGHENPDADALGAALAIAMLVEARGGRATVAVSDGVPGAVPRSCPASTRSAPTRSPASTYDLVVLCDCGDLSRAGAIRERNADALRRDAAR